MWFWSSELERFVQARRKVTIKYINEEQPRLTALKTGEWIDLRASESYEYKAGDAFLINLGVAMQLPVGYEAFLLPRSGTFHKYGIFQTNGMGIIDNKFCGDNDIWQMPVYALRDGKVEKHARVCQFRIMESMHLAYPYDFVEVDTLGNKDRGGLWEQESSD